MHAAADQVQKRKDKIDLLILNAGMSPSNTDSFNSSRVEMIYAESNGISSLHSNLTNNFFSDGRKLKLKSINELHNPLARMKSNKRCAFSSVFSSMRVSIDRF